MWEHLRAWLGQWADASDDGPGARERWRPTELPELLAAVFEAPGNRERRAVYADWLAEQGDPVGDLINLELAVGPGWAVDRAYAELLPRVLGDLAPILQPWAFELGLPVAGLVRGGRHDLLEHPQWATVRHVHTYDTAVCSALARCVPSFHVFGWPAFEALASAPDSRVRHVVLDITEAPSRVPPVRFDRVAVRGLERLREVVVALLDSPLREIRVHSYQAPDTDLIRRFGQHPTLERFVWRGGQIRRGGVEGQGQEVAPLPELWSWPRGLPAHLQPVRRLTRGANRRFWLVHDHQAGAARVAAIVDGPGPTDAAEVLRPLAVVGSDPEVELYPSDLEPLGPRPWSRATEAAASAILERLSVALDRPPAVEATRCQIFRRADGSLAVAAPVLGEPKVRVEDLFTVGASDRGYRSRAASGAEWAGQSVRGPRAGVPETGLIARPPRLWALLDAESPSARPGGVIPLVEHVVAESPTTLHDLLDHVLRQPWGSFGSASMVAAELGPQGIDLAWIGEARAYAVSVRGLRILTRDPPLEDELDGEGMAPQTVAAPVFVRMLGSVGVEFERRKIRLEPGERLLLCTASLGMHLDDGVTATAVAHAPPHEGVASLLAAYEATGAGADAACMLVDPVKPAASEGP